MKHLLESYSGGYSNSGYYSCSLCFKRYDVSYEDSKKIELDGCPFDKGMVTTEKEHLANHLVENGYKVIGTDVLINGHPTSNFDWQNSRYYDGQVINSILKYTLVKENKDGE